MATPGTYGQPVQNLIAPLSLLKSNEAVQQADVVAKDVKLSDKPLAACVQLSQPVFLPIERVICSV
jgi:hypothetical protein